MKKLSVNDTVKVQLNESFYFKGRISKIKHEFGRYMISVKYDEKQKAIDVDVRDVTRE